MKTLKIMSILFIAFLIQDCEDPGKKQDFNFELKNALNEDIFIHSEINSLVINSNFFPLKPNFFALTGQSYKQGIFIKNFENGNKLWILIFKKSTLDTRTWQEIKDQGLYDKRYSFTLEELKAINFQIIYDGN